MTVNRFCMLLALCTGLSSSPLLAQQAGWQVLFDAPQGLGLVSFDLTPDGTVYAVLASGGTHNLGTLVRRSADGSVSVLHDFEGPEGAQPLAAPTLGRDGNVYGSSSSGGQFGYGTAFRITPAGELTVLHHFTLEDGGAVHVPFTLTRAGRMLGVTHGVFYEDFFPPYKTYFVVRQLGKVFELQPDGTVDTLYEGILAPSGRLIETRSGDLYGVKSNTSYESPLGRGSVYRLRPDGTMSFIGPPRGPGDPRGDLVESVDGYLFGMDAGSVFRLSMGPDDAPTDYRVIAPYSFSPGGLVFGRDGKLYGGGGTFFSVSLAGELTWIANLQSSGMPLTAALRADGDDFIAASGDGLYRLQRSGSASALYRFGYQNGVELEPSSVMITRAGDVYGTTAQGGENNSGTLFRRDSNGHPTAIYHFAPRAEDTPSQLRAPLVEASGALYGITSEDPARLFRVDPGMSEGAPNELTTLHMFDSPSTLPFPDYGVPQSLVAGLDGALYGTIALPADANGTFKRLLYRFDLASHDLTELGVFDTLWPLLAAANGEIYGTGGLLDHYQLFRVKAGGERQVLYTFADDPHGHVPDSNLAEGPDGSIYGVAKGRTSGTTTIVYRWPQAGELEIYRALSAGSDLWPTPSQQIAVDANGDVYIKRPYQQFTVVFADKTQQSLPWASTLGFVTHPSYGAFRIEPLSRGGYSGFSLIPIGLH